MKNRNSRRLLPATLVTVLHLMTVAATPLLHAETQVISAQPAVEATHSERCPTIHNDATCISCGGYRLPAFGVSQDAVAFDFGDWPTAACADCLLLDRLQLTSHPVRAPPSQYPH